MSTVVLRRARREDGPHLIRLIHGLADYEKLTPPDEGAQARLLEDAFGERPRFEAWLGSINGVPEPVGYAIIFETYSTFLARPTLYLEDLFVLPEHRGRGVGRALLQHCVETALQRGCGRMEWTCLDWNTKAQSFYRSMGANHLKQWFLFRLTQPAMDEFLKRSSSGNSVAWIEPLTESSV